ncbi:MAG: isopentenyl-diphosphate Delta-isomerase [Firmicutes bacterium]|nr:isopentenyl-diphosphate Delta-isomerase [Bacillota bacterium]
MEDELILVNLNDEEVGTCGKMETHRRGLLHRAFSIFVFSRDPESGKIDRLLIQKRAAGKYHSAGKWANSCCSHPRAGENLHDAAARRLPEETGITFERCPLIEEGSFIYRAPFDNGLVEYEYDHVLTGVIKRDDAETDVAFTRNPEEADEMKFVDIAWLCEDVKDSPGDYAPWFITALPIAMRRL